MRAYRAKVKATRQAELAEYQKREWMPACLVPYRSSLDPSRMLHSSLRSSLGYRQFSDMIQPGPMLRILPKGARQ